MMSMEQIANEVCIALAITLEQLRSPRRPSCLSDARAIFAHRAMLAGWKNKDVAEFICKNHASVVEARQRYDAYSQSDELFQSRLELVERYLLIPIKEQ